MLSPKRLLSWKPRGLKIGAAVEYLSTGKMQLRYHPIMFCDGVRVWPPKWLQTHGRRMVWVSGEVGVLEAVFLSEVQINKVYLQISTEQGNGYLGILPFETAERAKAVFNFLFIHIHDTLETIGSMDFHDPPAKLN